MFQDLWAYIRSFFVHNNAKLWTNIVYAVITVKIWQTPLKEVSDWLILIWMSIVGGSEILKRVLAAKLGVTSEEKGNGSSDKSKAKPDGAEPVRGRRPEGSPGIPCE